MWRRVEERENFKCLLHKMPLIFEYPYQALCKTKCVWGGKYSKTMKVVLWRAAWMPCNSTYLLSWSTCPAFHHPFWERNPRHDAARHPCLQFLTGRFQSQQIFSFFLSFHLNDEKKGYFRPIPLKCEAIQIKLRCVKQEKESKSLLRKLGKRYMDRWKIS